MYRPYFVPSNKRSGEKNVVKKFVEKVRGPKSYYASNSSVAFI